MIVNSQPKSIALILMLGMVLVLFVACGGTRSGMEGEEAGDEVLGTASPEQAQADEDEVLRLLGISEPATPRQETPALTERPGETEMNTRVSELEETLGSKDAEISQLQEDIRSKDDKITELEQRLANTRAQSPAASTASSGGSSGGYKDRYEAALAEFNARSYSRALEMFRELLAESSTHSLSDNAQYWMGECYYGMGRLDEARVEFEKVLMFPEDRNNKGDDALLKLGIIYMKQGDNQLARQEFQRILDDHPTSEYRNLAQKYIDRL